MTYNAIKSKQGVNALESKFYTVNQIAKMFNMHPKTIRRYIQKGSLVAKKIGKEWRVLESDLKAFLDSSVEFHKSHLESTLETIDEFIHKEATQEVDTKSALTIVDLYAQTQDVAKAYCNTLIEVIEDYFSGPEDKFKFFFIEEQKKARFIFIGSPKYVNDMLQLLEKIK